MSKFAQFDPTATAPQPVIGWYNTDLLTYPNLPATANLLELTQAQWDGRFATPFVQAGALVAAPALTATQLLTTAQQSAFATIDAQAGATRLKYITDVAGQSETYLSKATDAAAYKAASYPSASIASYLMVQAEGKALYGATPTAAQYQAAADGIIAAQMQWIAIAAAIEQQRRAGKIAVAAAATAVAAQAAQAAAITALQAL